MKIESIVLRELSMSLIHPFITSFGETRERRVLLVEVRAEGFSGWGECTTGEHPFFNEESTDTAWITILQELAPLLTAAEEQSGGKCPGIFRRCEATAWLKLRSKMRCGIWRRRSAGYRYTISGRRSGRQLFAAYRLASSRRWKS